MDLKCQFCQKEVKNNLSKTMHEMYCINNPNKKSTHNKKVYKRKKYETFELDKLLLSVNGYNSLFSDKKFNTYKLWLNDIVRKLDVESCNYFFFNLYKQNNELPKCKNCNNELSLADFSYINKGTFRYFCSNCLDWATIQKCNHKYASDEDKANRSKRISVGLNKYHQTDEGKETAKEVGRKNSIFLKQHFTTDKGKKQIEIASKKQSKTMKEMIRSGQWTPNITNSWTHWKAQISYNGEIKKFRSSWEACFWLSNPNLQFETVRISYTTIDDKKRIYIADFYDEEQRIVYEIKPKSVFITQKYKMDAIIKHCQENNLKFMWINEHNIMNYIKEDDFINDFNKLQLDKLKNGIGCKN